MVKIIVDMMGGDLGVKENVEGVLNFLKKHDDAELFAVGRKDDLEKLNGLAKIVEAKDILKMDATVLEAVRAKTTSLHVAINHSLEVDADAIVSSGSTAAYLGLSSLKFKNLESILRPALVAPFPTKIKNKQVVILDIGANNENNAQQLAQFALMGKLYAQHVLNILEPKIFLLSNGTEEDKGSPLIKDAYQILKKNEPCFQGNIEARDALDGVADVIVTDGYTGNVFLKGTEGVAKLMSDFIKGAFKRNFFSKIGYLLSKKGFDEFSKTMNYKNTGGAMLLGLKKVAVKAHGSSDAQAFSSALEVAYRLGKAQIPSLIEKSLKTNEENK
ncbi:MAG: phosphate acyltransferase PlsX [Bacilli bacterium]|jgi:glycerol-3-phosphate acyltransferase PlsX|nr:phosphate acyltransferase PlsX [Bacilli bacterium]NLN79882.1 phosphate acyltransferase PlsX [Erysipelotrichia bacterium]